MRGRFYMFEMAESHKTGDGGENLSFENEGEGASFDRSLTDYVGVERI